MCIVTFLARSVFLQPSSLGSGEHSQGAAPAHCAGAPFEALLSGRRRSQAPRWHAHPGASVSAAIHWCSAAEKPPPTGSAQLRNPLLQVTPVRQVWHSVPLPGPPTSSPHLWPMDAAFRRRQERLCVVSELWVL
eukprot:GGOE01053947.1.p3 GENE.GGOE01053947.1~~GGOE01053947.1.p3  ORF type:complete len:134 (-),score=5.13 GGOE01053947.1:22-423(-)